MKRVRVQTAMLEASSNIKKMIRFTDNKSKVEKTIPRRAILIIK